MSLMSSLINSSQPKQHVLPAFAQVDNAEEVPKLYGEPQDEKIIPIYEKKDMEDVAVQVNHLEKVQDLEKTQKTLQENLDLKEEIARLKAKLLKKDNKLDDVNAKLERQRVGFLRDTALLRREKSDLELRNIQLGKNNDQLQNDKVQLEQDKAQLQQEKNLLQQGNQQISTRNDAIQAQYDQSMIDLNQMTTEKTEICNALEVPQEASLQSIKDKISDKNLLLERIGADLNQERQEKAEKQQTIQDLQGNIGALENEKNGLNRQVVELRNTVQNLEVEKNNLNRRCQVLQGTVNGLNDSNLKLTKLTNSQSVENYKLFAIRDYVNKTVVPNPLNSIKELRWGKTQENWQYEGTTWNRIYYDIINELRFTAFVPNCHDISTIQEQWPIQWRPEQLCYGRAPNNLSFSGMVGAKNYRIYTCKGFGSKYEKGFKNLDNPKDLNDFYYNCLCLNKGYKLGESIIPGADFAAYLIPDKYNVEKIYWNVLFAKGTLVYMGTNDDNENRRRNFFESINIY